MVPAGELVSVLEQIYAEVTESAVVRAVTGLRLGISRRTFAVDGGEHSPRVQDFLTDASLRIVGCFIARQPRFGKSRGMFLTMDGRLEPKLYNLATRHFHQYINECIDERLIKSNTGRLSQLPIQSVLWLAYRGMHRCPAIWYPRKQKTIQAFPYLALSLKEVIDRQLDEQYPSPSTYEH